MQLKELQEELNKMYHKYFTDSRIILSKACLGNDCYFVDMLLSNNNSECSNNIIQNDVFHIMFMLNHVSFDNDNNIVGDNIELTACDKHYRIKPTNEYCFCDTRNIVFRRVTGNIDKVINTLETFVKRLVTALKQDIEDNNLLDTQFDNDLLLVQTKLK